MQEIQNLLQKKGRAFIVGEGGIGKTQIAKAYAHSHLQQYDVVWWIDAEKSLTMQLTYLARAINKICALTGETTVIINETFDEEMLISLKDKLANTKIKWLIVLDNVKILEDIASLTAIQNAKELGHWIMTTRNGNTTSNILRLEKFTRKESLRFLNQLDPENYKGTELEQLADLLDDYPLALAQAFAYISESPIIDVSKYIELYKARKENFVQYEREMLKSSNKRYMDRYDKTLEIVTDIAVTEIKKKSYDAYSTLGIISVLNAKNIPEELILRYFNNDSSKANNSILELLKYSLVTKRSKSPKNGHDTLYVMHDITHAIIRKRFSLKETKLFLEEASRAMAALLPDEREDYAPMFIDQYYLLDHINTLSNLSNEMGVYNAALFQVNCKKLEYVLITLLDFAIVKALIKELEDHISCLKTNKDLYKARLLLLKGTYVSWIESDRKQSIKYALEAANLLSKKHSLTYENIMKCWRLAQDYSFEGDVDKMLLHIQKGEDVLSQVSIKAYDLRMAMEQCKTGMYIDQNDLQNALISVNKRDEINALRAPNMRNKDIIIDALDRAIILQRQGKYEELKNIAQTIDKVLSTTYKSTMRLTPIPRMIMAAYYLHTKRIAKAAQEAKLGIDAFCKIPIIETVTKARLYKIQGDILYKRNKYQEAMEGYLESERIYNKIFTKKRTKEISELYESIVETAIKLNDTWRASRYREKHITVFGCDNADSLGIFLNVERGKGPFVKRA